MTVFVNSETARQICTGGTARIWDGPANSMIRIKILMHDAIPLLRLQI
jgi:hypothetical protein